MIAERTEPRTIDEYIAQFPDDVQAILLSIRATIREAAPDAKEALRYGLPTFVWHGNLVHFGAFREHIGFYPDPSGIDAFRAELAPYRTSKGAIQFPLGMPVPYDLIRRITEYRVQENLAKAEAKRRPRT